MFVYLIVFLIIDIDQGIDIGTMNNVGYLSNDWNAVCRYNHSWNECICQAFFTNVSSGGMNCYTNNRTCYFFNRFLTRALLRLTDHSIFVFQSLDAFYTVTKGKFLFDILDFFVMKGVYS